VQSSPDSPSSEPKLLWGVLFSIIFHCVLIIILMGVPSFSAPKRTYFSSAYMVKLVDAPQVKPAGARPSKGGGKGAGKVVVKETKGKPKKEEVKKKTEGKKKAEKKAEETPVKAAPAVEKAEEPKAEEKKVEASSKNVEKIVEAVEKMTVLELSELVKVLEDRFGVTAAAPMAMMPGMMMGGGAAEEAEEQTEFEVVLTDFGSQKIQVIKVVRAITGLGLIEAKKMVEDIPGNVKEGASKEEAEEIKNKLEEVGATVEVK